MKVETKKLDKLKRLFKIEVSGEEFLKEKKDVYHESSKKLKVSGFRSGAAPLEVLERQHGDILKKELLNKTIPLFYDKALEFEKIAPAGMPRFYDIDLKSDTLIFSAEFETKPQVEVKDSFYKGIKIKGSIKEVKEVEIEKVITNIKEGVQKVIKKDYSDEDLAKWASYPDISSLREDIKAQLFVEKLRERKQKVYSQVKEHLQKTFKIDLPKSEIERHQKQLMDREVYNLLNRGVSQEDVDKYKKDLVIKIKPLAESEVKLFYILEAIAENEGIPIDDNLGDVVLGFILSQAIYEN